jgi:hypothetical protein
MRRVFDALPGPVPVKVLLLIIIVVVALIALGFLFEFAGDLLDDGGTIGA